MARTYRNPVTLIHKADRSSRARRVEKRIRAEYREARAEATK